MIAKTDPVTCAIYAKRNGLLSTPGWKRFKHIVKNQKKLTRMINQTRLHQIRHSVHYKFGVRVPRNHQQAMLFNQENKNTKWQDAELIELAQLDEYDCFNDLGKDLDCLIATRESPYIWFMISNMMVIIKYN